VTQQGYVASQWTRGTEELVPAALCPFSSCAGGSGEPDLQVRFVPGYALDPDAIKSYIKIGQLQETKKKWPAGETPCVLASVCKAWFTGLSLSRATG
jgi:hypothetical protein